MVSTLLLRLTGPLQAWGDRDRFGTRFTQREPTKSGAIGLVAAALGRPRHDSVDDLAVLRFGVRVDEEGTLLRDYHTVGGAQRRGERYLIAGPDGRPVQRTIETTRYYLADADFLVGLEGQQVGELRTLEQALRAPVWALFLGRKACVPGVPVALPGGGVRQNQDLEIALKAEPWPRPDAPVLDPRRRPERLRAVLECAPSESHDARHDQPVGPAFLTRHFLPRPVRTDFYTLGTDVPLRRDTDVPVQA